MRNAPNLKTLKFKQPDPNGRLYEDNNGVYKLTAPGGSRLTIISSDEGGWDHVSVSLPNRCPTWEEMAYVKSLFFRDDETAMELHVPTKDHRNLHPFCLHLWRPQDAIIPLPPAIFVA